MKIYRLCSILLLKMKLVERANLTKRLRGFTIVELLIVIVIIAILATITIVVYNGVQEKAYASKGAAVANSYAKIFELAKLNDDNYPFTDYDYICLGSADLYPSTPDFDYGECMNIYGYSYYVDDDFNDYLSKFAETIPSASLPTVRYDDYINIRGAVYIGDEQTGKIIYMMKGEQQCPSGQLNFDYMGNTECIVTVGNDFCWYGGDN